MLTTKPAARCKNPQCRAPMPGAWLDRQGHCLWCQAQDDPRLVVLDECPHCGLARLVEPYGCPCSRATRQAFDDAEYEVDEREAEENGYDDSEVRS